MRGHVRGQGSMLCLLSPEQMVPPDHPIRRVKQLADEVLRGLSAELEAMYSEVGRPSIPPERLLKATILMALYSVRSERLLCEQLAYNMLFRWFLDMQMLEVPFDASTFAKNRQRLIEAEVAKHFFTRVVQQARAAELVSDEHFTVDGTLIEAWASLKSFKPKSATDDGPPPDDPGNPTVDFRGQRRTNDTHASTTDPDARLAKKSPGTAARLCFAGHALMENRHGLLVDVRITEANGRAERTAAIDMLDASLPGSRCTLGADRGYDCREFVQACRERNVTPHVAQNVTNRSSAIDARTTRHPGYSVSQRIRKRVEEIFGWMKSVGGLRRTRFKGVARTQLAAYFVGAAYNLIRLARLLSAA